LVIAHAAKGAADKLQFHYGRGWTAGLKDHFWKPSESWRNKYRSGPDGKLIRPLEERFPLSTTALVFLTDGWHLLQEVQYAAVRTAIVILLSLIFPAAPFWVWLLVWVALYLLQAAAFHLVFTLWGKNAASDQKVRTLTTPAALVGIWEVISFLPGLIKIFKPTKEGKARRRAERKDKERTKVIKRYQSWTEVGELDEPITYEQYRALLAHYEATGIDWDNPPPPGFYAKFEGQLAMSVAMVRPYSGGELPRPIDLIDQLPSHPSKRYGIVEISEKVKYVFHMSGSDYDTVRSIAAFHSAPKGVASNGLPTGQDWPGIAYHEVTDPSGQTCLTQRPETVSYHCGGYNGLSVGHCLLGNFEQHPPTEDSLLAAVAGVLRHDDLLGRNCEVTFHNELRPGWTCPGHYFPKERLLDMIRQARTDRDVANEEGDVPAHPATEVPEPIENEDSNTEPLPPSKNTNRGCGWMIAKHFYRR
jgi:hypothetical protein